ncbi:MAG TPA: FG-GAP-like repeat-containing protein [Pyrinomonadaceae bacterium]|jgi:hypothetical protein
MNFRVLMKLKTSFVLIAFFVLTFAVSENLFAQKVRLRGKVTPTCASGTSAWKFSDIYADGNIAVQGSYNCRGAFIYDISNPDAPVLASWYNPGNNQQFLEAIVVGNRGYFGAGGTSTGVGVHIVDLTDPYNPVLLGTVDPTHGNGFVGIHEMMVFSQNGGTYLLENFNSLGGNKLLRFVNVTNPANPVFVRDLNPQDATWVHAMHIRGNKLYTSGWGGKIEIYDISNIALQAPALLGTINGNTTNHSTWTSEDGNYLYSCRETQDGDLRVYDVRNPAQPLLIKSIKAGDLGLNAITPHNPVVMGNYLYVAWYQAGIQVFDLTNPADPKRVGQYDTFQPAYTPPTEEELQKASLSSEPWDLICGIANRQGALPTNYDGNWAVYPFLGQNKILAGDLTNGLIILDATGVAAPDRNHVSDFDGDGKTDYSVYNAASGNWSIESSSNAANSTIGFGISEDKIVAGDYDGDGVSDLAIFRPSTGTWWIRRSTGPSNFQAIQFGLSTDIPVPGDYDADGKTDIAVFRPSTGTWYIQQSTLGIKIQNWGVSGDKAFTGDYDNDGKADLAIYRPSNGTWYISQSSSSLALIVPFGISTDRPVSADFDGDGKFDFAVYRPSEGNWYILNSNTGNSLSVYHFGLNGDMPIPSDFDGDGKADIAVFRPSDNVWYRLNSTDGSFRARAFGQNGDQPSPSSVQP